MQRALVRSAVGIVTPLIEAAPPQVDGYHRMIALVRAPNAVAPPVATDLVGEDAGGQEREGRGCRLHWRLRSTWYRCGCKSAAAAAAAAAAVGILPSTNDTWNSALGHMVGLHV